MFKKLKDKIAEESSKLQQSVSAQVAEGLRHHLQRGPLSSPGGSLHSGDAPAPPFDSVRRSSVSSVDRTTEHCSPSSQQDEPALIDISDSNTPAMMTHSDGDYNSVPAASSMMQEDNGRGELTQRQRFDSGSSMASLESSSHVGFLPSIPESKCVAQLPVDLESVSESAGSSAWSGASKEQISTVLHKLQGRAANYKDKYHQVARAYNDLVKENEKIRIVLTTTQDKALRRIQELKEEKHLQIKSKRHLEEEFVAKLEEKDAQIAVLKTQINLLKEGKPLDEATSIPAEPKPPGTTVTPERVKRLEELLGKCKETIKENKVKIQALENEKQELTSRVAALETEQGNAAISDLVAERQAVESRTRFEKAEKEYADKVRQLEDASAVAIAAVKQDMHNELESRESQIAILREKLRESEQKVAELDQRKENLTSQVASLEKDRKSFDRQLETVQKALAFAESALQEEKDNQELMLKTTLSKRDAEWQARTNQMDEQLQLALEEREMQKSAAVVTLDQKIDAMACEIEQLKTDKLQLESSMIELKESHQIKQRDLVQAIEENSARHKSELTSSAANHERALEVAKQELSASFEERLNAANQEHKTLAESLEVVINEKQTLETNISNLKMTLTARENELERATQEHADQQKAFEQSMEELKCAHSTTVKELEERLHAQTEQCAGLTESVYKLEGQLKMKVQELESAALSDAELRPLLNEREQTIQNLEHQMKQQDQRCQALQDELASITDQSNARSKELEQELQAVKQFCTELDAAVKSKETTVQELEELKSRLNHQLASQEDEGIRLRDSESTLQKSLADLQGNHSFLTQEYDNVQRVVITLQESEANLKERLQAKDAEISELRDTMTANLKERLQAKDVEISELREAMTTCVDGEMKESSAKIEALSSDLESQIAVVREKEAKIDQLEELRSALNEQLSCKDKDVLLAQESAKQLTVSLSELQSINTALSAEIESIKLEVAAARESESNLQKLLQEKEAAIVKLEQVHSLKRDEAVSHLECELKESLRKLDAMTDELHVQNSAHAEKDATLESIKAQLDSHLSQAEEYRLELGSKQQVLLEQRVREKELQELIEQLRNEVSLQTSQANLAAHELAKKDIEVDKELKTAQTTIDQLTSQVEQAHDQLTALQNSVMEKDTVLKELEGNASSELREVISRFEVQLNDKSAQSDRLAKERDLLTQQVTELDSKLALVSSERAALKEETQTNAAELSKSQALIDELNAKLGAADSVAAKAKDLLKSAQLENSMLLEEKEGKIAELDDTLNDLRHSLSERDKQNSSLRIELQQESKAADELRTQCGQALRVCDEKEEVLAKLRAKLAQATGDLSVVGEENVTLREELDAVRKDFAHMSKELDAKIVELESLKTDVEAMQLNAKEQSELVDNERREAEKDTVERLGDRQKEFDAAIAKLVAEHDEKVAQMQAALEFEQSAMESLQSELDASRTETEALLTRAKDSEGLQERVSQLEAQLSVKDVELRKMNDKVKQALKRGTGGELDGTPADMIALKEEHARALKELNDQIAAKERAFEMHLDAVKQQHEAERSEWHAISNDEGTANSEKDLMTLLKERDAELTKLKQQLSTVENHSTSDEQFRKRMEYQQREHQKELAALTKEWDQERRALEKQAQLVQGDVGQPESTYYLKERVKQLEADLSVAKEKHKKELDLLVRGAMQPSPAATAHQFFGSTLHKASPRVSMSDVPLSGPLLTEPTETEYLRNILFRYMTERETLGKEALTLAKVITAVMKFDHEQTRQIIHKEENRLSTW